MKAPELEAQALRDLGVPFLAGVPGSGPSYELLDACERAGIWFLLTAHEAAGAIIAGTAARQAGSFGAALSIKGPGVANLLGGLALARFENYPLLTFAEAYAPDAAPGLQHKRMPQDEALAAIVKGVFYRGGNPVRTMAALAAAEPAGPVHLNLVDGPRHTADGGDRPPGDESTLIAILDRIRSAARPILICGSALTRLGPSSMQAPALRPLHVPVFTTAAAKGVVDERSECSAGVFTGAGADLAPERFLLPQADLIVGIALRNAEVLGARPFAAPYVSVDAIGPEYQRGFDPVFHNTGELPSALRSIAEAVADRAWGMEEVARSHQALARHLDTDEVLPAPMYARLRNIAEARLVTDSGNFTIVAEHVWTTSAPCEFVGSSNGRFMGAALPQAIGVALQDPTRPVVCSVGDGGLPPFLAEIRIAVERKLPVLIVLMTDGHFGSMRGRVLERGFTEVGVRIASPSWERAVAGMGCPSVRATTLRAFDDALGQWYPSSGPLFVEAVMPDLAYIEMVKALRQ